MKPNITVCCATINGMMITDLSPRCPACDTPVDLYYGTRDLIATHRTPPADGHTAGWPRYVPGRWEGDLSDGHAADDAWGRR